MYDSRVFRHAIPVAVMFRLLLCLSVLINDSYFYVNVSIHFVFLDNDHESASKEKNRVFILPYNNVIICPLCLFCYWWFFYSLFGPLYKPILFYLQSLYSSLLFLLLPYAKYAFRLVHWCALIPELMGITPRLMHNAWICDNRILLFILLYSFLRPLSFVIHARQVSSFF